MSIRIQNLKGFFCEAPSTNLLTYNIHVNRQQGQHHLQQHRRLFYSQRKRRHRQIRTNHITSARPYTKKKKSRLNQSIMVSQNAIVAAFSSTALISLAPNVLLLLFPKFAAGEGHSSKSLSLGQALAAGGLLGDVFLHVVPHSGGSHSVGLWILLGFSIFLLTDMLMRSMGGGHSHSHSHSHDHGKDEKKCEETKTSTILLNLTADALHNVRSSILFW